MQVFYIFSRGFLHVVDLLYAIFICSMYNSFPHDFFHADGKIVWHMVVLVCSNFLSQ